MRDENLNETLSRAFTAIEGSAKGNPSEDANKGLFSDFCKQQPALVIRWQVETRLSQRFWLPSGIWSVPSSIRTTLTSLGDAYEFFDESRAGKVAVSLYSCKRWVRFARIVCDWQQGTKDGLRTLLGGSGLRCCSNSRSWLLTGGYKKFYGQEINPTTYNLQLYQYVLHDINFANFGYSVEDTLHTSATPWHAVWRYCSNPPYLNLGQEPQPNSYQWRTLFSPLVSWRLNLTGRFYFHHAHTFLPLGWIW